MKYSLLRTTLVLTCAAVLLAASVVVAGAARAGSAPKKKRGFRPDKRTGQNQIIPIIDGNAEKDDRKGLQ